MRTGEIHETLVDTAVERIVFGPHLRAAFDDMLADSMSREQFKAFLRGDPDEELHVDITIDPFEPTIAKLELDRDELIRLPAFRFEGGRKGRLPGSHPGDTEIRPYVAPLPDITPESHPDHDVVGRDLLGHSWKHRRTARYHCVSHDRRGYNLVNRADPEDIKNVSERAVGGTFHVIHGDVGAEYSAWGACTIGPDGVDGADAAETSGV